MAFIAPIVEGQGEEQAIPTLLHRMSRDVCGVTSLTVNYPIRVKSGSFINDNEYFARYVGLAAAKARPNAGSVLIVLDCEDDCPAMVGPRLLHNAKMIAADVRILIALAYREFETWFIAASESLRGKFGLPQDLTCPPSLDMRDAKGWLGKRMPNGYDPVSHQLAFVRNFSLEQARTVHSFNRLCERLPYLLGLDTN